MSPLIKGAITGAVMVALSLVLAAQLPGDHPLQYSIYAVYAGGILWTLFDYQKSPAYTGRFADMFLQGFRCFIVVTLILVLFTGISYKMHPEIIEEAAQLRKEQLKKEGNKTPEEIEAQVEKDKGQITTVAVSFAIFGYLITGAVFTAAGAGILLNRRS